MSSFAPASRPPGYRELREAVAWAGSPERCTILACGLDAVRFVDHFTTAGLANLHVGGGTEGFFSDARGWVLALAAILRTEDGLWIDALPGIAGTLIKHLEHHHIREDVELIDASPAQGSLLVAGPRAREWLTSRVEVPMPAARFDHMAGLLGDVPSRIVSTDWYGPGGFVVQAAATDLPRLVAWFGEEGLPEAVPAAVEVVRIEERLPAPADIIDKTLPQELDRDGRAISFSKGCYLGQETVARIDALGHVNRRFVLLAIDGLPPPAPGAVVTSAGEPVGVLTSVCESPLVGTAAGLALVQRRALGAAGNLEVAGAPARVVPPAAAAVSEGDG